MKINDITVLDYGHQDGLLVLVLANTSMEAVTAIDGSLLKVKTEAGDTVEVLAGYVLRSVTYSLTEDTYQATLTQAMDDTAAEAYSKLAAEVEDLGKAVEGAGTPAGVLEFTRIMLTSSIQAGTLDSDQVIACSDIIADWEPGKYALGTPRNHGGQTWRCCQAHDNATNPDIEPGTTAGNAFWAPYHGTTPATARPWVLPGGAHDIYNSGEMMVWTDGDIYLCLQDATTHGPDTLPAAWEKVTMTEEE